MSISIHTGIFSSKFQVNQLNDEDWVVHLDEETLLSASSVKGIINFVCNGKHKFGQGLITYANGKVNLN